MMDQSPQKHNLANYELITRALDGSLGEAEYQRLSRLIVEDEAFRKYYQEVIANQIGLHVLSGFNFSDFKDFGTSQPATPRIQTIGSSKFNEDKGTADVESIRQFAEQALDEFKAAERQREEELARKALVAARRRLVVFLSSLAALIAIMLSVWLVPVPESPDLDGFQKPTPSQLVATIIKSVNAQWKSSDYPIVADSRLFNVLMCLEQGLVQIEFDDGAEVILQAPCEFELQSAGKMFLQSGAVCAKVPQRAHVFTVETLSSSVVDYGSEFGVLVASESLDHQCEIHVFDGTVGVRSIKERQLPLTYVKRGQAAIVKTTGNIDIGRISDSTRHFVQRLFDADSGLVGWWRFEEDSGNVVKDSSGNGHDGLIVGGAKIVTDPERGQVLRNVAGGSVDLYNVNNPIPSFAANSSITLAAWVKREAGTPHTHSYVIQLGRDDDYPIATLGIKPKGEIMSYVETNQSGYNQDQIDLSGGVVEGRDVFTGWHHIAVVYDRTTDMATTYIDGLVDRRADISLLRDDYAFTWTAAHLGANSDNVRQYIGLMDDVAIFNCALTEVEIRAVMVGRILALIEK
jgi:hypothetical protein